MKILGLTGGMAAGKSTVASLFRQAGVPVFDADACVRQLQAPYGRSISALQKAFPGAVHDGVLDRHAVRRLIAADPTALPRLEAIIHPLVRQERKAFLRRCRSRQVPLCVLDIPLLWETGADRDCTLVMVALAPLSVRLSRIRQRYRKGGRMSEADAKTLLARQMPDRERRRRADIVIKTGLSRACAARQVRALLASLLRERQ